MENVGLMVALAGAMTKAPTAEQVSTAVDAWLDDHPEATTTVQDGAITKAKLNSSLQGTVDDVSDLKSALTKTIKPFNLYDKSTMTWETDGYISNSGSFQSASNYKTTKAIYLKAGSYLFNLYYSGYGASALAVVKTDENGTLSSTILTATNTGASSLQNTTILMVNIETAGYYRFNAGPNTYQNNIFMIVAGASSSDFPTSYVAYQTETIVLNDDLPLTSAMKAEIEKMPLFGEKIAADGDSICYGNGYTGGYAKIIADDNGMNYQNLAAGGGTIAAGTYDDSSVARHWICRSMQNIASDSDYILIEGGVNDSALNVTIGTITSGYTDTLDDTTFYGALETIFKTLTTKYVGKKYGFIIPHRMASGMFPTGNYYAAIMASSKKWGVKVLDLTQSVPPFNQFRNETDLDNIRTTYTTNGDGWHPTELCYREYYVPQIEAFMKTI